jgi:hypothetical protein
MRGHPSFAKLCQGGSFGPFNRSANGQTVYISRDREKNLDVLAAAEARDCVKPGGFANQVE